MPRKGQKEKTTKWDAFPLNTVAEVRLFLAQVTRKMMNGDIETNKGRAAADLARAILKTHEIQSAPESGTERQVAAEFAKVVSDTGSGTAAYDYQRLQTGAGEVQDGSRGETVIQDGVGEEAPGK